MPVTLGRGAFVPSFNTPFLRGSCREPPKGPSSLAQPARMRGAIVPLDRIMIRFLLPLTQRYNAGRKDVSFMTILRASEATTLLFCLRHELQGYLPGYPGTRRSEQRPSLATKALRRSKPRAIATHGGSRDNGRNQAKQVEHHGLPSPSSTPLDEGII